MKVLVVSKEFGFSIVTPLEVCGFIPTNGIFDTHSIQNIYIEKSLTIRSEHLSCENSHMKHQSFAYMLHMHLSMVRSWNHPSSLSQPKSLLSHRHLSLCKISPEAAISTCLQTWILLLRLLLILSVMRYYYCFHIPCRMLYSPSLYSVLFISCTLIKIPRTLVRTFAYMNFVYIYFFNE